MSKEYKDYRLKNGKVQYRDKDTGYSIVEDNIKVYRVKTPEGTCSMAFNKTRALDHGIRLDMEEVILTEDLTQDSGVLPIEAH